MDTQYIFGHDGNAMILETIGDAPSNLEGPFSVTVRTSVDEITHSCNVVRKYRSMEGLDGRHYDWYFIDNYFRDTDRTVRTDKNVAALEAASDRLDAQATYTAMMTDTLMEG